MQIPRPPPEMLSCSVAACRQVVQQIRTEKQENRIEMKMEKFSLSLAAQKSI